jgi:hypothetical protein
MSKAEDDIVAAVTGRVLVVGDGGGRDRCTTM